MAYYRFQYSGAHKKVIFLAQYLLLNFLFDGYQEMVFYSF